MNRICKAFEDIGNINMNWAGIPPFNWEMLLSGPCEGFRKDIVDKYIALDSIKISIAIARAEESPSMKEFEPDHNKILDQHIVETLEEQFGSLEECYPYIVKGLFAGENSKKNSHKQTFWRIFGEMALGNLKANLENCSVCETCGGMKYPNWSEHVCQKKIPGFFMCKTCGKIFVQTSSNQKRCAECQSHYRHDYKANAYVSYKITQRKETEIFITSLQSRWKKT